MLCTAFYVDGPDWLENPGKRIHHIFSLDGKTDALSSAWPAGKPGWLVLAAAPRSEQIRRWADPFPALPFPTAEGAFLKRLTH